VNEMRKRSARILIDLQACQTHGSAFPGVGRYSQALFDGIAINRGVRDIFGLVPKTLSFHMNLSAVAEPRVLRFPESPDWTSDRSYRGGERDYLDALAYSAFVAPVKADIVHMSHVFEGCGDRVLLPSPALRSFGQIYSATLFDLIPMLFQDHYFQDDKTKKRYLSRTTWLRQADLILATSDSSRRDAIDLLGIEPWRIVTIHGGISPHFQPGNDLAGEREKLNARYGLRERVVLYTGDDDDRRNIGGAIAGFAEIPPDKRRNLQLVIVGSMEEHRKRFYFDAAKSFGLAKEDVQITGSVPEADLITFYRTCDVFVFPSLYEGLGLPVLEAMACGAPVIGGNNSSVREIIVREDALFDAKSPKSIAEAIVRVLSDNHFSEDLRCYGVDRAQDFSWQRTSELAITAFDEALKRARDAGVKAAIQGWVPRKRIAMLTPLPPCRTGIADYNAEFLPFLTRHFDIDLYVDSYVVSDESIVAAFRVFDVKDFEAVAQSYDAILYEFGNSEFHAHMLPLLEKFPGIVGLHDAYLSGLMMHLEHFKGEQGRYSKEMLAAHGPLANRYIAPVQQCPDPAGKMELELPCTKRILDMAIGIISHSPFSLEIARKFYPEGWLAPYRIIPKMVSPSQEWSETQRLEARSQLGFNEGDFIIATFGPVASTNWGDRLLDGFLSSSLCRNGSVHLVYAGELPQDEFCSQLKDSICNANLGTRIHLTGFLDEQNYERYLRVADVAVQLRTNSRGDRHERVLDCLKIGLPVIVNHDAGYTAYSDSVVAMIDADPSPQMIGSQLEKLFNDKDLRISLSKGGVRYVRDEHDPTHCAAEYAAAIHEIIGRDESLRVKNIVSEFSPHLAGCTNQKVAIDLALDWLKQIQSPAFVKRRLIFDVSHIARSDHQTGIPRVVKRIAHALYCSSIAGFEPLAVELVDGVLKIASSWLLSQQLLSVHSDARQHLSEPVQFRRGDVLLMLDSSWARYREFFPAFEEARASRVPIYTVVYDLLPLTLPQGNIVDGGREWFRGWVRDAVTSSDGIVCISRTASDEVIAYLATIPDLATIPKMGFWHLGSDFPGRHTKGDAPSQFVDTVSRPYLLMVGTIEPRKNHELALAAMERLWERGHKLSLCIAGKEGWMVAELMARLRTHPLLGTKLFLIEGPTDSDMNALYESAAGLLFLSKGEGFGLPLVEAANHGVPIICSDIPVLHEIAGEFATYVALNDAASVAIELGKWWVSHNSGTLPNTRDMPKLSWEESAAELLHVVLGENWTRRESSNLRQ
jgi:glycosyltransferase involved in cell wall biosynthesis